MLLLQFGITIIKFLPCAIKTSYKWFKIHYQGAILPPLHPFCANLPFVSPAGAGGTGL
jgi:hypothetical protein